MIEPKNHTLTAPGAEIHYYVREVPGSTEPTLLLFGSPMEAAPFATLASHFTDRTVVTYDPRGAAASKRTDDATQTTPDEHADDLRRLIEAIGGGPVDAFGTSGGAVNLLALAAKHPELVRVAVAHEPPATREVPDSAAALAVVADVRSTYDSDGFGPAMAKFIALVMHSGEFTADYLDQPAPDPAAFGLPTEDDGSRDDALMLNMIACNNYEHDFAALRAADTRVVVAVGAESGEELPARAGRAVAGRLGIDATEFPSHHAGFVSADSDMPGQPEAFAARLREVLTAG